MTESVFAKWEMKAWPYRYRGEAVVGSIAGALPADPKIAEGFIRAKAGKASDDAIQQAVSEMMAELLITRDEAADRVAQLRHLNRITRDEQHGLYYEGRRLKAGIKEFAMVAAAGKKIPDKGYGETKKWLKAFVAEHVQVDDEKIYLGRMEPDGVKLRFTHARGFSSFNYDEYCHDVKIAFTVRSDHLFSDEWWAMVWLTGEQVGLGALRSQGYGKFRMTRWERVDEQAPPKPARRSRRT